MWIEVVTPRTSRGHRSKAEDYFLSHQSLAFSHSETILPGPGPEDSSKGTKPDIQKNELNPSHVRTNWCPMSSTCAEEIKQIQSEHPCSVHFYFCPHFGQSFPQVFMVCYSNAADALLTRTQSDGERDARIIKLKMIYAPFCPSWHLEHICSSGTRTDMAPASGTEPAFVSPSQSHS